MPVSPDQEWTYWDGQVTALRRGQLATVQQVAGSWRTLFGSLLGIFTAVAFAGGLTTTDKLASPWDALAKGATLLAVATAIAATYLANKAAGSLSTETINNFDPADLILRNQTEAASAVDNLKWAKLWGVISVGIVVLGSAAVLLIGPAPAMAPTAVVIVNGKAVCGQLSKGGPANQLMVDGQVIAAGVTALAVVPKCP